MYDYLRLTTQNVLEKKILFALIGSESEDVRVHNKWRRCQVIKYNIYQCTFKVGVSQLRIGHTSVLNAVRIVIITCYRTAHELFLFVFVIQPFRGFVFPIQILFEWLRCHDVCQVQYSSGRTLSLRLCTMTVMRGTGKAITKHLVINKIEAELACACGLRPHFFGENIWCDRSLYNFDTLRFINKIRELMINPHSFSLSRSFFSVLSFWYWKCVNKTSEHSRCPIFTTAEQQYHLTWIRIKWSKKAQHFLHAQADGDVEMIVVLDDDYGNSIARIGVICLYHGWCESTTTQRH